MPAWAAYLTWARPAPIARASLGFEDFDVIAANASCVGVCLGYLGDTHQGALQPCTLPRLPAGAASTHHGAEWRRIRVPALPMPGSAGSGGGAAAAGTPTQMQLYCGQAGALVAGDHMADGSLSAGSLKVEAYHKAQDHVYAIGQSDEWRRTKSADTNTMTIVGAARMHGYIDVHNRSVLSGSSPLIMSSSTAAVCVLFGSLHGSFHGSHSSVVCARRTVQK